MRMMTSALWPAALGAGLVVIVWLAARDRQIRFLLRHLPTHLYRVSPGDVQIIVENWLWPVLSSGLTFAL